MVATLGAFLAAFFVYLCTGIPVGYLIAWKEIILHIILIGCSLCLVIAFFLSPESASAGIGSDIASQPLLFIVKLVGYIIGLQAGEVAYKSRGDLA